MIGRVRSLGKLETPRIVRLTVTITEGKSRNGWSIRCRQRAAIPLLLQLVETLGRDTIHYPAIYSLVSRILDTVRPRAYNTGG